MQYENNTPELRLKISEFKKFSIIEIEIEIKTLLIFKLYNVTLCYNYKIINININSLEL